MKLARREKNLILMTSGGIALFLLIHLLIFPFFEKRSRMLKGITVKEEALKEIVLLSAEYQAHREGAQGMKQTLSQRKKDFTLFSFLERAAGEAEIKTHIKSMKPSVSKSTGGYKESVVEMKLEKITLKQLTNYLYHIESPKEAVSIKRISIKEKKGETGYLDAILQVMTFDS